MESFSFRTLSLIELQSKQVNLEAGRKEEESSRLERQIRNKQERYLKEHKSFQAIRNALADKNQPAQIRAKLTEVHKLTGAMRKKKGVLLKTKGEVEELKGEKEKLSLEIVNLKKRSDKLGEVATSGLKKIKNTKKLLQMEGAIEEAIIVRAANKKEFENIELNNTEIDQEELMLEQASEVECNEVQELQEHGEVLVENSGNEEQGIDNAFGSGGDNRNSHAQPDTSSHSNNGGQHSMFSEKSGKNHTFQDITFTNSGNIDSFDRQIEEVSSWKSLGSTGVELSYTTDSGKKIRVEIIGNSSHAISVKIKPENLRQKQTLWYERGKIVEALTQSGLKVVKVEVG